MTKSSSKVAENPLPSYKEEVKKKEKDERK